ncbi:MAG: hypothetical protein AAF587_27545 [Bacteroidota bacterium]
MLIRIISLDGNPNNGSPGSREVSGPNQKIELHSMQLFIMMRDPGEGNNVIDLYPEKRDELLVLVEEARSELRDKLTDRIGRGVRPVGQLPEVDKN